MRVVAVLMMIALLAGCGGGSARAPAQKAAYANASTSGPIAQACLRSDRKARSVALCGCIQQVAHMTFSGGDQSRGATFWRDPHKAQEVRQSDNPATEAFWKRWRQFGETSQAVCS